MKTINLNELRDKAHKNAVEKGFWEEERPIESYLMLVICEIAEAVEADRKGKTAKVDKFKKMIDGEKTDIWDRIIFPQHFETYIKDSVCDEIADVAIRLLDLAGELETNLTNLDYCNASIYYEGCFPANAFTLTKRLFGFIHAHIITSKIIRLFLAELITFSEVLNIDLLWHIEQKMRYNENRPHKHGKEY